VTTGTTLSIARIGGLVVMRVENYYARGRALVCVRLHEKGGKQHVMPCHRLLTEALRAYLDAVGIAEDCKGFLFRTSNATTASRCPASR
jgi:integrase/recombinase XerC